MKPGQGRYILSVTPNRDLTGDTLRIYATDEDGETHILGARHVSQGGTTIPIAFTAPTEPGFYEVEVARAQDDLPPIFPEQDDDAYLIVDDVQYND